MNLGLDHAARPSDYPAFARAAVDAGYTFEFRYLCTLNNPAHDGSRRALNAMKIARPNEIQAARDAGLEVALIWQDTKRDSHDGRPAGRAHGAEALRLATEFDYPSGSTIYFAIGDYDAPPAHHNLIADYLVGVREVIDNYRIGGYGKRSVVEDMLQRRLITKAWQSYGFSRPVGEVSRAATCYQRREQRQVHGITCDVNEAFADIGGWKPVLKIVRRPEWKARAPKARHEMRVPSPRLWLHHTAAEWHGPSGVRQTQNFHMDTKGWNDIAYSFLVDDDGTTYEGRGSGVVGGHTEGDNSSSHAICAMGDFTKRNPTPEMVAAIVDLVRHGNQRGWWNDHITGGHRNAPGAQTACPGDRLARLIPEINRRAASTVPQPAPAPITFTTTEFPGDDMKRIDTQINVDDKGYGYTDVAVDPMKVVSVVFNTQNPATQGYKPAADWHRLNVDGKARIVVEEALPGGRVDISVWVAA